MNCDKAQELLNGYLDGELRKADRLRVETHLQGCTACRAELAAYRLVQERAQSSCIGPPAALRHRIARSLSWQPPTREVRNMKTRLSIAFGIVALAAIAFVALRPSEAYANLDQVKRALKQAKKVHAVTTVRDGKKTVTQEAWVTDGNLRIDVAGRPAKLVKGQKTFLWSDKKGEGVWEIVLDSKATFDGEITVDFVLAGDGEWKASPQLQPVKVEGVRLELMLDTDTFFRVVGIEELDGRKAEKAIMHKPGDPYRTVMWLDPITKLPIQAERQKLNGEIWDVVSQVKYDFTKPIPPDTFEPKKG